MFQILGEKKWLDELLFMEIPNWQSEQKARKNDREARRASEKRQRTIYLTQHLGEIRSGIAHPNIMYGLACTYSGPVSGLTLGETVEERFAQYCENGGEVLVAAKIGFRLCPVRSDLPTVDEIIDLNLQEWQHDIRFPCLIGMELRWEDGIAEIRSLLDDILQRMITFWLTYAAGETPEWFTFLVQDRPQLVSEALIKYASAALKAGKVHVHGIYALKSDSAYRNVAAIAVPELLRMFPVRSRTGQLSNLESLLKAAMNYARPGLQPLIDEKLTKRGMDAAQKVYWYAASALLDPDRNETALWRHIGKSEVRATHLAEFLANSDDASFLEYDLSTKMLGKMIELIAPNAQVDWSLSGRSGEIVSETFRRGELVRALINRLAMKETADAAREINRLLTYPALEKLRYLLESARHQQKLRQREGEFRFLRPAR